MIAQPMVSSEIKHMVHSLAVSPNFSQDHLCFSARNSGLFRSVDGGETWASAYMSLGLSGPLPTTSVVFSPDFASDSTLFAGAYGTILTSDDAGRNWLRSSFPAPAPFVTSMAISPDFIEDGVVIAGTIEDGIVRSIDRGQSWAFCNFGLIDRDVLAVALSPDFAEDDTMFAGTQTGLYRGTNGGRSWAETPFPVDAAPILSLAILSSSKSAAAVLAGTETHGLWQSEDMGRSWARLDDGSIQAAINGIMPSLGLSGAIEILITLDTQLLLSRNGGHMWSDENGMLRLDEQLASVAAPEGLHRGAMVLSGLRSGEVRRLSLPD